MSLGATDKQRSLFLKGFKLSKQGNYEDPTYLGFKVLFDFGSLPVGADDGLPPSPLLKQGSYLSGETGLNTMYATNPFGQPQYDYKTSGPDGPVAFYSAASYLQQREANFLNGGRRSDMLIQFTNNLRDLVTNYPWFLQSISGLDNLSKVARPGFQDSESGGFNPHRTAGKTLEFKTLESLNLRMTALANLYNQATFDYDNMRELVPRNLRKFTMYIMVSEIRNFFKTSRLLGASAALQTIDNFANLLGSGNNPGSNIASSEIGNLNNEYSRENSNINPASSFNSFVGNILGQAGVDNDFALLKNQQDQSGIKPVIIFECKNCEFDFTESTPIQSSISQGSESPSVTTQSFKIHVGKVRIKSQFPNIRQDGKPLILGDSWDGARSSVQSNPRNTQDILSLGGELLTNFVSNSLNDLINEGVANLNQSLSGANQLVLGNAYSFNPSQVLSSLSFNSAQNFLDNLGSVNSLATNGSLPNPQTAGLGGPPERVYTKPTGDSYPEVPGKSLGVPDRVYPQPNGDVYAEVPGKDLGVPDRVYPQPNGDQYSEVPGKDLGVPDRVYPQPSGDAYVEVPGKDLGVPDRVYPQPSGDAYAEVPGKDLGVPQRVYPQPTGDEYIEVPGRDLGVPDRVYPKPTGDVYSNVPGKDLGVPDRSYESINEKVYPDTPAGSSQTPQAERVYPELQKTSGGSQIDSKGVYPEDVKIYSRGEIRSESNAFTEAPQPVYSPRPLQTKNRGEIGKVYPSTAGDFIVEKPLNLGNLKPPDKYNISEGGFNTPKSEFE